MIEIKNPIGEVLKTVDAPSLQWANLREANLQWANLHEVNLREVNLRDANLQDADLQGADLRRADLRDAVGNGRQVKTIIAGAHPVTYTLDKVFIGCKAYDINSFVDEVPEEYRKDARFLNLIIKNYPAIA